MRRVWKAAKWAGVSLGALAERPFGCGGRIWPHLPRWQSSPDKDPPARSGPRPRALVLGLARQPGFASFHRAPEPLPAILRQGRSIRTDSHVSVSPWSTRLGVPRVP
jgi:hypothetical protein